MPWLPDNADFLTVFSVAIAAAAATVGLLGRFGEFASGALSRSTLKWVLEALASEEDPARRALLNRSRLETQARLVAAREVRLWRFTEILFWAGMAPAILLQRAAGADSIASLLWPALASLIVLAAPVRRAIRLYSEQHRIATHYVRGGIEIEPARTDIVSLMEGGTRREWWLALAISGAFLGLAGSVAWLLTDATRPAPWIAALVTGSTIWFSLIGTREYVQRHI